MGDLNILGISGALRKASTNTMLLEQALISFGPAQRSRADLRLPLYDGDLEAESGVPAAAQTLFDQIVAADAVVISTPEYNKAPSGVLKNALDWVSRIKGAPWEGKPVAIMSAAAGRAGGERSQYALRLMLTGFGPKLITTPELCVAQSGDAFNEDGTLKDARYQKNLDALMAKLRAEATR